MNEKGKFHKCSPPTMCPKHLYPSLWGQIAPLPPAPPQQGWHVFAMSKWHRWRANHWVFSCLPRSLKAQGSSWWLRQSGNGLKKDASPLFPSSSPSCRGECGFLPRKSTKWRPTVLASNTHIQISRGYLRRELLPSLHTVTQPASSSSLHLGGCYKKTPLAKLDAKLLTSSTKAMVVPMKTATPALPSKL